MKKSRLLALTGLTLSAGVLLASCANNTSSSNNTYSYVYATDPSSLDYLIDNRAINSEVTGNLIDGLFENDKYGNFVPSLAEDWTVSKDGLTYTYKLRKDAKWYTADGEEYANVTAHDFVAGMKHAADGKSEALYLAQESIKGLDAYVKGENKDFSSVGVRAVDDYTLEYTLNQAEPYWNTKLTSTIFFPVNEEFLKSKGSDFGKVGTDSLLYNGPYFLKSYTSKSSIEYAKNPNYYDKDNVHIDNIKLSYYDGTDQESLIRNFNDGVYTVARLFPSSSNFATVEKQYKDNIVYSQQDATSYYYSFNFNRQAYNHTSKTSDDQKNDTKQALLNRNFRVALNYAFDRSSYSAQANGEAGATNVLRNTYVPPTFVQIGSKSFGEVAAEKLVNYNSEWAGIDLSDAHDAYYNVDKAKASFAKAKEELQAQGVQFPIHLDIGVAQTDKVLVQQVSSFKQSVESALGAENVVIDIQQMSEDDFLNTTYFATASSQKDYDIASGGWSPDYQDPSTYLDTFRIDNGGNLLNLGFEPGVDHANIQRLGLDRYTDLVKEANAETQDLVKRYEKYAEAQAWLLDNGIILPFQSLGGVPSVSRSVPYSGATGSVGSKGKNTFKYMQVQNDVIKADDFYAARKQWEEERATATEKAQKEQAEHVK